MKRTARLPGIEAAERYARQCEIRDRERRAFFWWALAAGAALAVAVLA